MESNNLGSLDRFLLHRGPDYTGYARLKASARINGSIGLGLIALGVSFVVASLLSHDPGVAAGATGPIIGGAVNLGMALSWRKKAKQLEQANTILSPEAVEFMRRLMMAAFGWRYKWMAWENGRGVYHRHNRLRERIREVKYGSYQDQPQKPASQIVSPLVFGLLEAATAQYNRIYGLLTSAKYAPSSPIGKIKPSLMQAIEDAMAEILHHAALLDKFPEGNASASKIIETHTASLREAADRVESMVSRDVENTIEAVSETSALESVLQDLRLSDQAQKELEATELPVQTQGHQ